MSTFIEAYRLVTFVPPDAAQVLAEKISAKIPRFLGQYDHVAYWTEERGVEQYRPVDGEIQREPSVRLEFTLPKDEAFLKSLIKNDLISNHPWEEPVILVFDHRIFDHGALQEAL